MLMLFQWYTESVVLNKYSNINYSHRNTTFNMQCDCKSYSLNSNIVVDKCCHAIGSWCR